MFYMQVQVWSKNEYELVLMQSNCAVRINLNEIVFSVLFLSCIYVCSGLLIDWINCLEPTMALGAFGWLCGTHVPARQRQIKPERRSLRRLFVRASSVASSKLSQIYWGRAGSKNCSSRVL
jgi:hypothetical protein